MHHIMSDDNIPIQLINANYWITHFQSRSLKNGNLLFSRISPFSKLLINIEKVQTLNRGKVLEKEIEDKVIAVSEKNLTAKAENSV